MTCNFLLLLLYSTRVAILHVLLYSTRVAMVTLLLYTPSSTTPSSSSSSSLTEAVFRIQENTRAGAYVGTLRRAGAQKFSVTNPQVREFSVDRDYGDIRVAVSPDREEKDRYEMTVVVLYDGSEDSPQTPQAINVVIIVTDVNDNAPHFLRKIIPMTITESQPVGFKIPLDPAEDPDLGNNSTQTYNIVNQDVPFRLAQQKLGFDDQYSCNLELIRPLDREDQDYYLIDIIATDGGNPPRSDKMTLQIKIADVNDNTPQFNQSIYQPSISEAAPVGSVVCTVLATDRDKGDNAEITYLLEPRFNKDDIFSMDPDTGVITLSGPLDREVAATHDLLVRAVDRGTFPERATVRVSITVLDVNDNTPHIIVTFLSQEDRYGIVSESSDIGDYVAHVNVQDRDTGDNGAVTLILHGQDIPFQLARVGSGYVVRVSGALDREERDTWRAWLEARDGGTPPRTEYSNITIRVIDTNDSPPVFGQEVYRCNVSEISEQGTDIIQVTATDRDIGVNAEVSYYIVAITSVGLTTDVNNPISFSMNSASGVISTGTQLDREARESVELTIEARDGGSPSLTARCKVVVHIIDYNDNDPRFSQRHYTTLLSEDAPVGTTVLTVEARDIDAGGSPLLVYSIKEYYSSARRVFTIAPTSGVITTLSRLDYEQQKSYNLVVEAHDNGGRRGVTSVEILIRDLNDNAPLFSRSTYKASLLHTVLPGTLVTRVTAFDVDSGPNGIISYSIVQGAEKFSVEPATGFISTTVSLHGTTNLTEKLIVQALDGGTPQKSSVCNVLVLIGSLSTIDLKPVFSTAEYGIDIPETLTPGRSIATVYAKSQDPDYTGAIKYAISHLTRQVHDTFAVEETSGRLVVKCELDRETHDSYNFVIEATDELGRQGMTSVLVRVTDVNDNRASFTSPSYHFSISEGTRQGQLIAQLTATDLDYGINGLVEYAIISSPPHLPFSLNSHTGHFTLTGELDFEETRQYRLQAKAYNKVNVGYYHQTDIVVSILDENDNSPLFIRHEFVFHLLDSSLRDATVGLAMATDRDSGSNGELYYTLQPTVNSDLFQIDLNSGEIRTAAVFANLVLQDEYTLKVLCRDRGVPSLNSTALVTVKLRSTGEVVDMLQQVLQNHALSRKAKYLIIFFATAFLFSTLILVCFIKYHRRNKSKYRAVVDNARRFGPVLSGSGSVKSSEHLISVKPEVGTTLPEALNTTSACSASNNKTGVYGRNSNSNSNSNSNYKYVECGSYCPSIPDNNQESCPALVQDNSNQDIISTTFFAEQLKSKLAKESALHGGYPPSASLHGGYPPSARHYSEPAFPEPHRTSSRSDVASSYGGYPPSHSSTPAEAGYPGEGGREAGYPAPENRSHCHSNESGVHSTGDQGSTPPSSNTGTHYIKDNQRDTLKDNLREVRSHEKVKSWMSSDDSLFKIKNPIAAIQKLSGQKCCSALDKRQVRFQKLQDSFV